MLVFNNCHMTTMSYKLTQVVSMHRALGHPDRFRVAHLVALQPLSVTDIQSVLELPQPVVSKHLAYLQKSGLVERCRSGKRVFYSAPTNQPPEVALLIDHLRRCGSGMATLRQDAEVLGRTKVASFRGSTGSQRSRDQHDETHIHNVEYNSQPASGLVGSDGFID